MKKDNIYEEGSIVYAKHAPHLKLIIRRYVDRIYYCKSEQDTVAPDQIYFERELTNVAGS